MIKFTAFRTTKPRQFNYVPRFYDPEKEAREERKREVLGTTDDPLTGEYVPGQYIRSTMRNRLQGPRKKKNAISPLRVMMLLAVLGLAIYLVMR